MNSLRILTYNDEFVGFDGDLYINFCQDSLSNCLIGICSQLKITLQNENHRELFLDVIDAINLIAESLYKEGDWLAFAYANKMEVRDIPNLTFKKKGRFRLPTIYFVEADSIEELENGINKY